MNTPDPVDREIRHHLEERIDRLIGEGWTREEAEREAARLFGDPDGVSSELRRLSRRRRRRTLPFRVADAVRQDLASGYRQLRRHPVSSGAALLVMILGIGLATSTFSVVNGVLLRPLPFREPETLVAVHESADGRVQPVSPASYLHWRTSPPEGLEGIAVLDQGDLELGGGDDPMVVRSALVSHEFFALLGIEMARGRGFRADEDRPGAERVTVLSDALWRSRFGADPEVLGTTILLQGQPRTVVGIAPPGFDFPTNARLWLPYGQDGPLLADLWGARFLDAYARLRDDVDIEAAQSAMRASLREASGQPDVEVVLTPLKSHVVGAVRGGLLLLSGAVVLVLLVACANVGNLLLSRATARRPEMALRAALGAGRLRMTSILISESLVLAIPAGLGGYAFVAWGIELLIALAPQDLPRAAEIRTDVGILIVALVIAAATGVVAGLIPALRAATGSAVPALRQGSRTSSPGRAEGRLQSALLVGQVAATVVLLVAAGLLGRSFLVMVSQDPGFEHDSVVTAHFGFPRYRYATPQRYADFFAAMVDQLEAVPGVQSAAFVRNLPISRRSMTAVVEAQGRPVGLSPRAQVAWVTPGYVETMRIPLLRGRTFDQTDSAPPDDVVLVSNELARILFPGQDPLGRRVRTGFDGEQEYSEIVGVVGDVRHQSLTDDPPPILYYTLPPVAGATLVARTTLAPSAALAAIETTVHAVDPEQPISQLAAMDDLLAQSVAQPRFYTYLLSVFALVTALLAMVGLYGVMSGAVQRRQFEIGVRMAMGADARRVRLLVVGQALATVGAGVVLGLAGAAAATRLLERFLFGITPGDPATLVAVIGLTALSSLAATYPAVRRAARVDPLEVLKG